MDDIGKIDIFDMYGGYKMFTLKYSRKNSWFDCHRRFLDVDHTYRHSRYGFRKNTIESEKAPIRLTG